MCMNCGCGAPEDRHGDPANITRSDLERAAEANGQTLEETIRNITQAGEQLRQGQASQGQAGG